MKKDKSTGFMVGPGDEARRIDRVTRQLFPHLPLSAVFRALRKGQVRINNTRAKYNTVLHAGDQLNFPVSFFAPAVPLSAQQTTQRPQQRSFPSFETVYETDSVLVINKAAGAALFGSSGVIHSIRRYIGSKQPADKYSITFKPSFVHRIDIPTSGLVICAKTLPASRNLSDLMRRRMIRKDYLAVIEGRITREQDWDNVLFYPASNKEGTVKGNAKRVRTHVVPLCNNGMQTLVRAEIYTGRKHQIRMQAALHHHPLSGDKRYGGGSSHVLFLHAGRILLPETDSVLPVNCLTAALRQNQKTQLRSLFGKPTVDTILSQEL